jgi:hypothetical protein
MFTVIYGTKIKDMTAISILQGVRTELGSLSEQLLYSVGISATSIPESLVVVSHCVAGSSSETSRYTPALVNASLHNKRRWCVHTGSACILSSTPLQPKADGRLRRWDKLLALNRTLHSQPDGTWVLWLDCDALFTSVNASWQELIPSPPWHHLVLSKDCNGPNSGVFLIKNTKFGRSFLQQVYDTAAKLDFMPLHGLYDQAYITHLIDTQPSIARRVSWAPQKRLNAFYMDVCGAQWQEGDWILHQVNCHDQRTHGCNSKFIKMAHNAVHKWERPIGVEY